MLAVAVEVVEAGDQILARLGRDRSACPPPRLLRSSTGWFVGQAVAERDQECFELSPLGAVQAREQLVFGLALRASGFLELSAPGGGDGDDVAPAVQSVALARDVALGLEVVEEGDEDARIDALELAELALARRTVVVEEPEQLELALAEYVVVPEAIGLTKISRGLDHATAGALGLAGAAAHAAIDAVAPSPGETVLISGATGGVGAIATQLASARGAEVIATATAGEGAEFVKSIGAAHTVDHTQDLTQQVRSLLAGGVHSVVHLAGDASELADLVLPNGRMASTLGVTGDQLGDRNLEVTAVMALPTASVLDRLAADVAAGTFRVPVQRAYRLEEAPQAIADFARGTMGKLAIAVS